MVRSVIAVVVRAATRENASRHPNLNPRPNQEKTRR